ncbi:peptidyl-tRNA hydrolase [candidate division MSBL1 archaeon SCGC-AAA259E19]|uniref:Peptidyl-tRNA hydrolase n=2 Tax=candidate division MSBL1 TaxID=215777 RepID=A0A133V1F9_9EURY|nr:peptidyl-tRNA hydrolase [candidate division MSBL1 archaeon SCGC-AAA259E19]KXB00293.1 peptidyl-tRNA hydrolase [candidate division MSBL1 archaeon SCGC-AAA259O05]
MFEYKQVMVARTDLLMSPGKLAVQVAHASLSAAEICKDERPEWFENWREERQKKVVVEVSSEDDLEDLKKKAERTDLPYKLVTDAGLTELEPGTATVLGVGPGPNEEVDEVTGHLPLYEG